MASYRQSIIEVHNGAEIQLDVTVSGRDPDLLAKIHRTVMEDIRNEHLRDAAWSDPIHSRETEVVKER